jgi:CheY-like chemotaxis protein
VRGLILRIFADRGCSAIGAAETGEALRLLEMQDYDLILADQSLPRANGLAVLRAMRRLSPRSVGILSSAAGIDPALKPEIESAANAFLSKPFQTKHLAEMLDRFLPAHEAGPTPP